MRAPAVSGEGPAEPYGATGRVARERLSRAELPAAPLRSAVELHGRAPASGLVGIVRWNGCARRRRGSLGSSCGTGLPACPTKGRYPPHAMTAVSGSQPTAPP